MEITVNGKKHALGKMCTVDALVESLQLDRTRVAVEQNGAIVPKSTHASTALNDGDVIEIVHFIGGG